MNDEQMHRNWVRNACVEHAINRNKYRSADEIIREAKQYERYVADMQGAEVVRMVK